MGKKYETPELKATPVVLGVFGDYGDAGCGGDGQGNGQGWGRGGRWGRFPHDW